MSDVGVLAEDEYLDKDYFLDTKLEVIDDVPDTKTDKKMKILKIVFTIMCLLFAIEFCVIKFIKPSLASPKITIRGNARYSAEEIATCLLPMNAANWFDFDVDQAVNMLCAVPGIENVIVEKEFPNKIYVNVTERVPVAITFVTHNGKTVPVQIDGNGVLFYDETNPNINSIKTGNLPIVSGIPIDYLSNGMRIPKMYLPLMDQIAKIWKHHSEYFAGISEICVLPSDYDNYELALISAQSPVRVITDRALNEDALKDMMVVLDVINLIDADVREVDLRYRSISYKTNN